MKYFALIPAKKKSTRCPNKNWRDFIKNHNLVDFLLGTIPPGFFDKIIVSTNNVDYKAPETVEKHLRDESLSGKDSHIEDLIQVIIREYRIGDQSYLWLLNPVTPFRLKDDYEAISRIIKKEKPAAVISAVKIHPFIWRDKTPLHETTGYRRSTQDIVEEYFVENGMFFVVNVGHFRRNNSWYGGDVFLYKQSRIQCFVDIDTEDDFRQAQEMGKVFLSTIDRPIALSHKK